MLTIITVVKACRRKLSASSVDDKCIIIFTHSITIQCSAVVNAQAIKIVLICTKLFITVVLHVACLPRLPIYQSGSSEWKHNPKCSSIASLLSRILSSALPREAGKHGMVGTGTGMCDRKSHTPQAKYIYTTV